MQSHSNHYMNTNKIPIQTNYQVASAGRRLMNFIIDIFIYEIGMLVLVNPIAHLIFPKTFFVSFLNNLLLGSFMLFLYYFIFELAFQRTPGKFITSTKVTMVNGVKPKIGTIAERTLIRFVPFDAISMYTGKELENKGTWWHDRWVDTRVVKK
jgi:uncharacterized RDD family membrane protein YckC